MLKDNPQLLDLRESEDYYYDRIQQVMNELEKAKNVATLPLAEAKLLAERAEFIDGVDG